LEYFSGFILYNKLSRSNFGMDMAKKKLDFHPGQVFGRLTLTRPSGITKGTKRFYWYADCECGFTKDKLVSPYKLREGSIVSCGCLREENAFSFSFISSMKRSKKTEAMKRKVEEMPEEVKKWLANLADGDIKKGVRRLMYFLHRDKITEPPKRLIKKVSRI
jgi:hypothetical protein